jgi:Ca2+-binding RTX toxin-like protein
LPAVLLLAAPALAATWNEIEGTANADHIRGADAPDRIHGLEGNDVLRGRAGDDRLVGGLTDGNRHTGPTGNTGTFTDGAQHGSEQQHRPQ